MIKAGIIGFTGYAGRELARLLLQRDDIGIKWYGPRSYINQKYASIHRSIFRIMDDACMDDNMKGLVDQVDVMFTATPRGLRASLADEDALSRVKVTDLSANFYIKDVSVYGGWCKLIHISPRFIGEIVYGLPEINRKEARGAGFIVNPRYLSACSLLFTHPLVKEGFIDPNIIIIDAKPGTSDASRGSRINSLYCEVNENIKVYGVASHRHMPGTEEQLFCVAGKSVAVSSTPYLVPMSWGILVTTYTSLTEKMPYEEVKAVYDKCYRDKYFVRIPEKDAVPQTRWVEDSNFTDVNSKIDTRTNRVVMIGAVNSMVKGAAGQAVRNMNLMFGLPGNTGLK